MKITISDLVFAIFPLIVCLSASIFQENALFPSAGEKNSNL